MRRPGVLILLLTCILVAAGVYVSVIDADTHAEEPAMSADKEMFEKAVEIIKKYEGLHQPRHYPLVGYGHKVLPGEKYSRRKTLAQEEAEALLRKDLLKNCAVFREWGADSLILGVLAYNIGSGNVKRSTVAAKLKAGDRDIRELYLRHCRYRGKVMSQIQRRRVEEYDVLFIKEEPGDETGTITEQK